MAIAFVSSALGPATDFSSAQPTVDVPKPAGAAAGHFALAIATANAPATATTFPSGWTVAPTQTNLNIHWAWKFLDGSEGSTFTFTSSSGSNMNAGSVLLYSGVNTSAPINAEAFTANVTASTSFVPVAATTTAANCLILHLFHSGNSATGAYAITPAAGYSERIDNTEHVGVNWFLQYVADILQAAQGATATPTFTSTVSALYDRYTIALAPALASTQTDQVGMIGI